MGGVGVTREEVHGLVEAGRRRRMKKKALAKYVRDQLGEKYPDLVSQTIVRNGYRYNALDYLMLDLDSYGQTEV